ncbi:protein FAM135B isoform X1 [Stegostoma tigrinum]|uniref:protein FAM135B isoform X1 n=1 Tax=Stegostoma tigrinum TaxID=3053191 RepID=UPI00202AFD72|nr:protein FAM135B isoform X1 [Stegostoma tigrinum]XP_048385285.1 protein FAM135B isoform X1 [Stegostoma tigrinum]
MSEVQGTVEFSVELHKFYNVDLFQRGYYQVRAALKIPPRVPHRLTATLTGPPGDSVPGQPFIHDNTAYSKIFQILYRNEEIIVNNSSLFRVHLLLDGERVEEALNEVDFQLKLDLHFTDSEQQLSDITGIPLISSRRLGLHFHPRRGLHHHIPVMFDYFHLSVISVTAHASLVALHQPLISFPRLSKGIWLGKNGHEMEPNVSNLNLENLMFGSSYYKQLTVEGSSNVTSEDCMQHVYRWHENLCRTLLSAYKGLLCYFSAIMKQIPELHQIQLEDCLIEETLCQLHINLQMFNSPDKVAEQISRDLAQLCSCLAALWSQFLDSMTLQTDVTAFLSQDHHSLRVRRFSEAFFFMEHQKQMALTFQEYVIQRHSQIAAAVRNSSYLTSMPPLPIECLDIDGDWSNLPIIFEDRYVESVSKASYMFDSDASDREMGSKVNHVMDTKISEFGSLPIKVKGYQQIHDGVLNSEALKVLATRTSGTQTLNETVSLETMYNSVDLAAFASQEYDEFSENETKSIQTSEAASLVGQCQGELSTIYENHSESLQLNEKSLTPEQQETVSECIETKLVKQLGSTSGLMYIEVKPSTKDPYQGETVLVCSPNGTNTSECSASNDTEINQQEEFSEVDLDLPCSVVNSEHVDSESVEHEFIRRRIEGTDYPIITGAMKRSLSLISDSGIESEPSSVAWSEMRKPLDSSSDRDLVHQIVRAQAIHRNSLEGGQTESGTSLPSGIQASLTSISSLPFEDEEEVELRKLTKSVSAPQISSSDQTGEAPDSLPQQQIADENQWLSRHPLEEEREEQHEMCSVQRECGEDSDSLSDKEIPPKHLEDSVLNSSSKMEPIKNTTILARDQWYSSEMNNNIDQRPNVFSADRRNDSISHSVKEHVCKEVDFNRLLDTDVDTSDPDSHTEEIKFLSAELQSGNHGSFSDELPNAVFVANSNNELTTCELVTQPDLQTEALELTNVAFSDVPSPDRTCHEETPCLYKGKLEMEQQCDSCTGIQEGSENPSAHTNNSEFQPLVHGGNSSGTGNSGMVFEKTNVVEVVNLSVSCTATCLPFSSMLRDSPVSFPSKQLASPITRQPIGSFGMVSSTSQDADAEINEKMASFIQAKEELLKGLKFEGLLYSNLPLLASNIPYFTPEEEEEEVNLEEGIHLIICVHGLDGNSADLRLVKTFIELGLPGAKLDFLMSERNQSDTFADFDAMTDRLLDEIIQHIHLYNLTISRISFIGHSLGNIIIRSVLTRPRFRCYLNKLHTFLSLSGPHLGTLYNNSTLVSTGLWLMQKLKKSSSLLQLTFKDQADPRKTFLYKLSEKPGLQYFKNVMLVASTQDRYVPFHSARIEMCKTALKDRQTGSVYTEMINNLLRPVTETEDCTLIRYDIFHALPNTANALIGRAAHIAVLDSELFLEKFLLVAGLNYFK